MDSLREIVGIYVCYISRRKILYVKKIHGLQSHSRAGWELFEAGSSMMLCMSGSIACLLCKPVSTSLTAGLVENYLERYNIVRGLEHRRLLSVSL
ncbi:hypothetical protein RclHR1_16310004 [Rhizophagus clarus]|uniref:Uncharacterized protein n=1 Tax=Rhizophagus clarus TaxID=94130 RepID=A0A2Z6QWJ4_9GLOM|nr:hypothetical protein RclHR1_16310004 [Rhizophagus clarus]